MPYVNVKITKDGVTGEQNRRPGGWRRYRAPRVTAEGMKLEAVNRDEGV